MKNDRISTFKMVILSPLLFVLNHSFGQIYSRTATDQTITITPKGIVGNLPSAAVSVTNVGLGEFALSSLTTGSSNNAFGYSALRNITTGSQNVAVGTFALTSNTEGSNNVAIGTNTMVDNIKGTSNIAIGGFALQKNTNGGANIAIGSGVLANHSFSNAGSNYSSSNIGIGSNALQDTNPPNGFGNSGKNNIAIGTESMFTNTTGFKNISLGYRSLYSNSTGFQNISIGADANYNNTIGSTNIAIGNKVLELNTTGQDNIVIGGTQKGGKASSNISIGIFSLAQNTHAGENIAIGNAALTTMAFTNSNTEYPAYNIAIGTNALKELNPTSATNSSNNVAIGANAGYNLQTGINNVFLGYQSVPGGTSVNNSVGIGHQAIVNASNKVVIGNIFVSNIGGYAIWTNYSDKRLKENIVYTDRLGLEFIKRLKTTTYSYKNDPKRRTRDGLIAQDVQQVLKDLNLSFSGLVEDENEEKTLNISYGMLVIPLINAAKEQQKTLEDLEKELSKQSADVQAIKTKLATLEARGIK